MYVGVPTDPPPPPGTLVADRLTLLPPGFESTKGGGPPSEPLKQLNTPRIGVLAGSSPRGLFYTDPDVRRGHKELLIGQIKVCALSVQCALTPAWGPGGWV